MSGFNCSLILMWVRSKVRGQGLALILYQKFQGNLSNNNRMHSQHLTKKHKSRITHVLTLIFVLLSFSFDEADSVSFRRILYILI